MNAAAHHDTTALPGVQLTELTRHTDNRGAFVECFRMSDAKTSAQAEFTIAQANISISARGVIRGIHYFADTDGQTKHVTCVHGEVLDVAVDLRVGSPTFGRWLSTVMTPHRPKAVYLPLGVGHAFIAVSDYAVIQYLCSQEYVPGLERSIDPCDPDLGLPWPSDLPSVLSDRDRAAPSLREASEQGLLPKYEELNLLSGLSDWQSSSRP